MMDEAITDDQIRKALALCESGQTERPTRHDRRDGRIRWEKAHRQTRRYHAHTGETPRVRRTNVWNT